MAQPGSPPTQAAAATAPPPMSNNPAALLSAAKGAFELAATAPGSAAAGPGG